MSNIRTAAQIKDALDAITAELKQIETASIPDADLGPLAKSITQAAGYLKALDTRMEQRAITDGVALVGVVVKDKITHRAWHDAETAAELAYAQFGLKAFKLETPAAIEKLGKEGEALVAVASFKPPAGKRLVY